MLCSEDDAERNSEGDVLLGQLNSRAIQPSLRDYFVALITFPQQ